MPMSRRECGCGTSRPAASSWNARAESFGGDNYAVNIATLSLRATDCFVRNSKVGNRDPRQIEARILARVNVFSGSPRTCGCLLEPYAALSGAWSGQRIIIGG